MKIGFSGHQRLENLETWSWVEQELDEQLSFLKLDLTGISSLAIGSDQLFAKIILKHGGKLQVVLPFPDYERTFDLGEDRNNYLGLLERASAVEILSAKSNDEESYFEAGKRVVELSDIMMTVWNGKKAAGLGGTGDAVQYAKEIGKKVIHINPVTKSVKVIESNNLISSLEL